MKIEIPKIGRPQKYTSEVVRKIIIYPKNAEREILRAIESIKSKHLKIKPKNK